MWRHGQTWQHKNLRIPAGLLPELTYDKLQQSCPEPPSWCVTQAHLAGAVGCDISPPAKKILRLFLKNPSRSSVSVQLELTDNKKWILKLLDEP